jgi:hypothetical protein
MLLRFVLLSMLLPAFLPGSGQEGGTMFRTVAPAQSGIRFANTLTETDSVNILHQANLYNGGGVGIGDFNGDGRPDVYFAGNMVPGKLYLNEGGLRFRDVTAAAGVDGGGSWCTGVTVADVNNDGRADLYLSASFRKDPALRTNRLYINEGADAQGVPRFTESAAAYGLADTGFSTQGYFFDYDRDGDLDLYQLTNALYDPKTPIRFRPKVTDGSALNTDRLYRNNGNGTFTNVSAEAGITIEGWGHAACISDFNRDGWPDIYVANDFVSNDLLYINNGNGTFTDRLPEYFRHTGWNAMGTEVADLNNDGFPDLLSLEMLPEDNSRKKRMLSGNEYYNYFNSSQFGYTHQYVRNVLQLNSGPVPGGHPVFSDVSFLSGTYQTDWSWCPLVADFDNDGLRDLIVTNGLPRDVTDLDYIAYENGQGGTGGGLNLAMAHTLPVVHIPNYAFRNTNGVQFKDVSAAWGLTASSFSNGGAYADFDNDGDLDLVVSNINSEAFLFENTLNGPDGQKSRFLRVELQGPPANRAGLGARLSVYAGGRMLYYEHYPARGYLSTHDSRAHFGLGEAAVADSVVVLWPDGKKEVRTAVPANGTLTLTHTAAAPAAEAAAAPAPLFTRVNDRHGLHFRPVEEDFIDYTIQPTLPHKLSQYGPGIAVGDIDGNGTEDVYVGGTSAHPGRFFLQGADGRFTMDSTRIPRAVQELEEEMGVLLFDADGDKDLDLYAVTGSYEIPPDHAVAADRLYRNDGKGFFEKAPAALPGETSNGSVVRAADFDRDGDLDLFVGGRVVSGAYPLHPKSFIYRNDGGTFRDVTAQVCPPLQSLGMITDALWSDFDNDGRVDLVLAGEWMPVTFLRNTGTALAALPGGGGIGPYSGWWNSLAAGDFDGDGDIDYVAGNLGLNSSYQASAAEPMTLLAKDLDDNGALDAMVFCYMKGADGRRRSYPMHTREDLSSQLVSIRKRYPTYKAYGLASIDSLWTPKDRQGAVHKTATWMQSSYIENRGGGRFSLKALPLEAQAAPVYGMLSEDADGDGRLDLLLVGNDYGMEPYSGRHDAFNGLLLKGDGRGGFQGRTVAQSGFFVPGDAKGLARLYAGDRPLWLVSQNTDSLLLFARPGEGEAVRTVALRPDDFSAEIRYRDGSKRKVEFFYGSTYLSQSARRLAVEPGAVGITITSFKGVKRTIL